MKKLAITTLFILSVLFVFSVTITNPMGPAVIPVTGLLGNVVDTQGVEIEVSFWKDESEAVALLVSNQADFAVLPITVGANLYAQGMDLTLVGVHEWKAFYLIVDDVSKFTELSSLKGKEVYSPHGRGQTVDVLLRYLLVVNGLAPDKDVKFYYLPPQEIVSLYKAGKIEYAALPEPFSTLAVQGTQGGIVLDFQEEWNKVANSNYGLPIAGLFVKKEILDKNPKLVEKVERAFSESVTWANTNLDEALKITNKYLTIPISVLKEAMKRLKFEYINISQCKDEVMFFLNTMHDFYPEGLPSLPDGGFYYK